MPDFAGHYNFWVAILLLLIGLYPVMGRTNLVKRIIGLSLFQTGIFLLYISMGKVFGGTAPIAFAAVDAHGLPRNPAAYTNSIPTALILTGIVVSVATLAVALALAVCIKRAYGTIEMDEIEKVDSGDPR